MNGLLTRLVVIVVIHSCSFFSLRELLAAEDAGYLEEATTSKDSLAQRIAKMRQKAKRIREEKESEHSRLVQEKYDQRFRRDCAELRELQSKELDHELGNEHLWQMQEKFERKQQQQVRSSMIDQQRLSCKIFFFSRRTKNFGHNYGIMILRRNKNVKIVMHK